MNQLLEQSIIDCFPAVNWQTIRNEN